MKKLLTYLLALAALTGCGKAELCQEEGGRTVQCTFVTAVEAGVANSTPAGQSLAGISTCSMTAPATKDASAGAETITANRCIMEVWYGTERVDRRYAAISDSGTATFTLQLVSSRAYNVIFWADKVAAVGSTPTEAELATDLYYATGASGSGLKNITLADNYSGNNADRDAFCFSGQYTVTQNGRSFGDIKLTRPLAQVNVVAADYDSASSSLRPDAVSVTLTGVGTSFDALTGAVLTTGDISYTASVTSSTVTIDYIFAPADAGTMEMTVSSGSKASGSFVQYATHTFTAVPYRRNYRTNITGASFCKEAVVATKDDATTIDAVNSFIASDAAKAADIVNVTVTEDLALAVATISTADLKEGSVLNLNLNGVSGILRVTEGSSQTTATINITVASGKKVNALIVNAPAKDVNLYGTYGNVAAHNNYTILKSASSVETFNIYQGKLEIHGTVTAAYAENTEASTSNPTKVRACENLSESVYNSLKDYIAAGYTATKDASTSLWTISKTADN